MHRDGLCAVRGSDGRVRLGRFEGAGLNVQGLPRRDLSCTAVVVVWTLGELRRYGGRWPGAHVTPDDFTGAGNERTSGDSSKPNNQKCVFDSASTNWGDRVLFVVN